jgi:hypothetical protein
MVNYAMHRLIHGFHCFSISMFQLAAATTQ